MSDTIYIIEPEPNGDEILEIANILKSKGFNISFTSEETRLMLRTKEYILGDRIKNILSTELLQEEILPDNIPRNALLDTLKYKLLQINATNKITIIDCFLYPNNPDIDYEDFFIEIFKKTIVSCAEIEIITKKNRNTELESNLDYKIKQINPDINIIHKYSNEFHDRFWIANDSVGLFVGTSLNGIGRRYSIIDYLQVNDVADIVNKIRNIL